MQILPLSDWRRADLNSLAGAHTHRAVLQLLNLLWSPVGELSIFAWLLEHGILLRVHWSPILFTVQLWILSKFNCASCILYIGISFC